MRIGIDLGGTKIEGIALDAAGRVLWRERVATPRHDYRQVVAAVVALVQRIRIDTRLLPPRHGDSSGVRGAAWLWPQQ